MNKKSRILLFIFTTIIVDYSYSSVNPKYSTGQYGFIENKGQIIDQNNSLNPSVLFLFNGNGFHVQLKQNSFSYEVIKTEIKTKNGTELNTQLKFAEDSIDINYYIHRVDISFVNSNQNVKIISSEASSDYINYYTTGTPEEGITNVHHYKKVLYKNIYTNIDVEFCLGDGNSSPSWRLGGAFKYNFIVHPGGNPNDIQLKFDGATSISLTTDGHITIETAYGNIDESIPSTYQLDENNNQQIIAASFNIQNLKLNIYGIGVGKYDTTKSLVIDPFPSTYYGGSGIDGGYGIVTDSLGDIILTGNTSSTTAIATTGSYQTTLAGNYDVFMAKFFLNGTRNWATYYGGSGMEYYSPIVIDLNHNIYIGGYTTSTTSIATTGSYQSIFAGYADSFIAKFDSTGARLWATYYGGTLTDACRGIACDILGNIVLVGSTSSTSSIASSGAYQTTYAGGGYDVFIVKFNSTGNRLWATYYGGSAADEGFGVATDVNGNIYVTGDTYSTSSIAISGAFQTLLGGYWDAFIVKFDSSGSVQWGTYYGKENNDQGQGIAVDASGNILVTGWTSSPSGMSSSGGFQTSFGGGTYDAFILKFNSSGSRIWATYYGGSGDDVGKSITADASGNVFITGSTSSTSAIASTGAFQTTNGGGTSDAFVVKFSPSCARNWGTYFGGSNLDDGWAISTDNTGNIFIAGRTASTSAIADTFGYQTTFGGGLYDAFIAGFANNGNILPIQLTFFNAMLIGNWQQAIGNVLCTWQTASELNNDYFEVERSVDGLQFTAIGKVKGIGTSNVVNSYQFTDQINQLTNQPINIYYRLKQTDFDGKSTLSDVRVVNLNQTNTDWNIYPNPTSNELHIETTANEKFDVQLFDITGKKVMESILFISSTTINLQNILQGLYFVRITDTNGVIIKTQKVAVVR